MRVWASYFHDGTRYIRGFSDMRDLDRFTKMTGAEWLMFLQQLPLVLQDGNGILLPETTVVSCFQLFIELQLICLVLPVLLSSLVATISSS